MKKIYKLTIIATAVLLLVGLAGTLSAQTVVYVASDGSGDGTSWATAAGSIQDAIEASSEGTEIWIKAGTYYVPGDSTFNLKNGVSLYGGFAGTETCPIQRTDFGLGGANETILSGDIDKNGITDAANANRVVYGKDILSDATVLSGLTITGGYAVDSDDGGGLRLSNGSPSVVECSIFDNWCGDNGGGIYIASGSITKFFNCHIVKNYAGDRGGGAYIASDCNAIFTNCVVANNFAENEGGGIRNYNTAPIFNNCTFVYNAIPGDATGDDGTAMQNSGSSPVLNGCVFWGNTNNGLVKYDISNSSSTSTTTTNYCAIEGTLNGDNVTETGTVDISAADPLFTNTAGSSGVTGYDATSDWSIQTGSPLIGMSSYAGGPVEDINWDFRTNPSDIGAYEFDGTAPYILATDVTGEGSVTPRGYYARPGFAALFTITPASGYEIDAASYNGTDILATLTDNGDGSFSYAIASVSEDGLMAVTFEALAVEYVVTVSAGTGGTIAPVGDTSVTVTDVVEFTITPATGYVFGDLLLNDVSVKDEVVDNLDGTLTYTLTGVGEVSTLAASFLEQFTVTITAGANGTIDPTGTLEVTTADETEFTITANTGFLLDALMLNSADVTGDVTDNGDGTYTYTLTGVDADATLAATFVEMVVNVVYITEGGTGDGSSWGSAAGDIQVAIDAGELGDEIWVAKGTYIVPTDTSFVLKSGVSLHGGFAGTESSKNERKQFGLGQTNETKLSADVDGNGFLTGGNAPRVIFGEFISPLTTISGFTITGGFSDVEKSNGAGMKLRASSPNILNCTFYDNYCDDGAALYLYRSGEDVSSPLVKDCFFFKGLANDDGGAIYNASGTEAQYVNCVFAHNEAKDEGGAVRNYECSPSFINCTFVYNALPDTDPGGGGTYGPAIRNYQTSSPYMNTEPDFINCVFWGNVDGTSGVSYCISNTGAMATAGAFARVVNCAIMDSVSASSCILIDTLDITSENPGFIDVSGTAGYVGYNAASNWGLSAGALLIGEGTNSEEGVPERDITGKKRGVIIDIGAYEFEAEVGIQRFGDTGFEMEVYPNPSNGLFYVKVDQGTIHEIALYDMTGRQVYRNADPGTDLGFSINIEGQHGMFLLRVSKENGETSTRKVLISH